MTLFAAAAPEEPIFEAALEKFFGGKHDALTIDRLLGDRPPSFVNGSWVLPPQAL